MTEKKSILRITALLLIIILIVGVMPTTAMAADANNPCFRGISISPYGVPGDTTSTITLDAEHYGRPIMNIECSYDFYVVDYATKQPVPIQSGINFKNFTLPSNAGRLNLEIDVNVPEGRYQIAYVYKAFSGDEGPYYYSDFYAGSVPTEEVKIERFAIKEKHLSVSGGQSPDYRFKYTLGAITGSTINLDMKHYHKDLSSAQAYFDIEGDGTVQIGDQTVSDLELFTYDFTEPVTATLVSSDGEYTKEYTVDVINGTDGSGMDPVTIEGHYRDIHGSGHYVGAIYDEETGEYIMTLETLASDVESVIDLTLHTAFGTSIWDGEYYWEGVLRTDAYSNESYSVSGNPIYPFAGLFPYTLKSADGTVTKNLVIRVVAEDLKPTWWDEEYCEGFFYQTDEIIPITKAVPIGNMNQVYFLLHPDVTGGITFDGGQITVTKRGENNTISYADVQQQAIEYNQYIKMFENIQVTDDEIEPGMYDVIFDYYWDSEGEEGEGVEPNAKRIHLGHIILSDEEPIVQKSIQLFPIISSPANLPKTVGDAPFTLTALRGESTGAYIWISSEPSVASIESNGDSTATVTIKKAGVTQISVIKEGDDNWLESTKSNIITITVSAGTSETIKVTKITLDKTSASVTVGETVSLISTVLPSDATNKGLTWATSNTGVAAVSTTGVVKAVKAGTATITATAKDGSGKTAACKVTVNPLVTVTPVDAFVERLYTVVLGRASEASGKKFHIDNLVAKKTDGASTAIGFFLSPEMTNRNLSDSAFIDVCYKTFFNRSPEADGKKYWQDWLNKGVSRKFVLAGFINSPEYTKVCADYGINRGTYTSDEARDKNTQVLAFVSRLYSECLGRKGDANGLNFYSGNLLSGAATGKEIARGFVYSPEFDKTYKTQQAKVTAMYKAILGRNPDANGLNYWMVQTKDQIFDGMTASTEFSNICNSYGIRVR